MADTINCEAQATRIASDVARGGAVVGGVGGTIVGALAGTAFSTLGLPLRVGVGAVAGGTATAFGVEVAGVRPSANTALGVLSGAAAGAVAAVYKPVIVSTVAGAEFGAASVGFLTHHVTYGLVKHGCTMLTSDATPTLQPLPMHGDRTPVVMSG